MVLWGIGLVRSRGILANAEAFRYVYVASTLALLAVVPPRRIRWPSRLRIATPQAAAAAAALVLVVGGVRAAVGRDDLQTFAEERAVRGREADGTLLVLGLGTEAIPDDAPISFFGRANTRGTADRVRALLDHYGSPYDATPATADRDLVSLQVARAHLRGVPAPEGCAPLEAPISTVGLKDHGSGLDSQIGGDPPLELWALTDTTIEVRRFGSTWVPVLEVPRGRGAVVTLPALNSAVPWEVRADGACAPASVTP
jgi:hypothetical protein